ncbi:MAG: alpha/beta fold hydrolase [Phycisphaerae bacterium]|nr:alpha/beta fold hydrolase [Phycisphaerae bacterium]
MRLTVPSQLRRPVYLVALAAIYGLCLLLCGSAFEAVYLASVPGLLAWIVLARPSAHPSLSRRHLVYLAVLAVLVTGYLFGYARVTPLVTVRWGEIVAAMYFLGSLHVILWCLDAAVHAGTTRVLSLCRVGAVRWRRAVEAGVRVGAMFLLGGPVVAAALTTHWVKFDDANDPRRLCGLPYERAGFYTSDGVHIRAWYIPSHDALGDDSTVILVPGRGMGKASALGQATKILASGSNVLLVDLRGEGASSGHSRGFGVVESKDVSAAVCYLRQAHPHQSRQVFALGISQGATAVLGAAATDRRIEAVVADSVPPSPRDEIGRATSWLPWPLGGYFREATLVLASMHLGHDLRLEAACSRIAWVSPRPVLLIHGQEDTAVPIGTAERLYASAGGPVRLWRVPGAGHAEPFLKDPRGYAQVVTKTFKSVRLGLPAFQWASGTNR